MTVNESREIHHQAIQMENSIFDCSFCLSKTPLMMKSTSFSVLSILDTVYFPSHWIWIFLKG